MKQNSSPENAQTLPEETDAVIRSEAGEQGPQNPQEPEGLDEKILDSDYPMDDVMIRDNKRTVREIIRRIDAKQYIAPEFQRDFIWNAKKQSKLIESALMRVPLPVFYVAENKEGKMVIIDGLQRVETFRRFVKGELKLQFPDRVRPDLHGKRFNDLPPKYKNRIEDCHLTFYSIDENVPERVCMDIFDRVNGGIALTRQQMRNCLCMGEGTRFLKKEAETDIFRKATGNSLDGKTMRDREFVNRFCAFQVLGLDQYPKGGHMDDFLSDCLKRMNTMEKTELDDLSTSFQRGLANNLAVFDKHAFRKIRHGQKGRSVINASLWDVMSTGLSMYPEKLVEQNTVSVRDAFRKLLGDKDFDHAVSRGTRDFKNVKTRFRMVWEMLEENLGAPRFRMAWEMSGGNPGTQEN